MTPDRIVEFAEDLARIAAAGGGCTALAAHLAQTASGGVLLEDAEWRHVAAAGGAPIPPSARDLLVADSVTDRTPHAHRNGRPGASVPVLAGALHLGWLSLFPQSELEPEAAALLRLTASAIALELAKDRAGGRGRRQNFWERLVGGAYGDMHAVRDDAAARGVSVAGQYVVVALEPESPDDGSDTGLTALHAFATESFHATDAEMGIVERGTRLLLLLPAAREVDADNARTAATLLAENRGEA